MTQRELTGKFEGCKLEPYRCPAGKLTIGYGHNIEAKGLPEDIHNHLAVHGSITHEMADRLLDADLDDSKSELVLALPWVTKLSPPRLMVLLDMAFNMGVGSTKKKSGLLAFQVTLGLIKSGQYDKAADAMLNSKWANQVKSRALILANMMRRG